MTLRIPVKFVPITKSFQILYIDQFNISQGFGLTIFNIGRRFHSISLLSVITQVDIISSQLKIFLSIESTDKNVFDWEKVISTFKVNLVTTV